MLLWWFWACSNPEPTAAPAPTRAPDVILVTLDTTRADRVGAYGHAPAQTDTIDQLAKQGIRFSRAYSVLPLTIPAHASMFTGLYPFHHRIRENGDNVLAADFTTMAEHFKQAGYQTAASVAAFVTTRQWGFAQGFDAYYDDVPSDMNPVADDNNYWHTERIAGAVVDDALSWLGSAESGKPVFLWVHLYDVHYPYAAPPEYNQRVPERPYDAELAYVDDQVARLVEAFSGRPALFALIADHGESLGEHNEQQHGLYAYDTTQHIPFILSGAGVSPAVVDTPVSQVDLLPTLLKAAGLPVPGGLDGAPQPGAATVPYAESYQLAQRFRIAPHRAVVSGPLKLIATPEPELYDVVADPGETKNLAASRPEDVARLHGLLAGLNATPPSGAGASLDADTLAALAALGYVSSTNDAGVDPLTLPDPKQYAELLRGIREFEATARPNEPEKSLEMLDRLLAMKPDVFDLRVRKSTILGRMGRKDEARAYAEATADMFPENPRAWLRLATDALLARDPMRAYEMAERARAVAPNDKAARELSVDARLRAKQVESALRDGEAWMAEDPTNYGLASALGRYWLAHGDYAKADSFLRIAVSGPNPKNGSRVQLAALAIGSGQRGAGYKLLEAELDDFPNSVLAHRALARLQGEDQLYLEQLPHLQALARLQPRKVNSWLDLAQCQFNLKDYRTARKTLERAIALDAEDAGVLLLQANLLAKEGKMEEGRAMFERAEAQRKLELEREAKERAEKGGAPDAAEPPATEPSTPRPAAGVPNSVASPTPRTP